MQYHVPMCSWCGEDEVGAFYGSDTFCSQGCEDACQRELREEGEGYVGEDYDSRYDNSATYDDFLSQYDDDPSPYDGTYSEE